MSGQGAWPIGFNNPFRYRGYYFDYETNFYYLHSKYYDPVNGRFISPSLETNGANPYVYCGNNPVSLSMNRSSKISSASVAKSNFIVSTRAVGDMVLASNGSKSSSIGIISVGGNSSGIKNKKGGFKLAAHEHRDSWGHELYGVDYLPYFWAGVAVYSTKTTGGGGFFYSYYDNNIDFGNITDWELPSVGVGINFWDYASVEVGVKVLGVEASVSIWGYSLSANANILGSVSVSLGSTSTNPDGTTTTKEITVGVNVISGLIAVVVYYFTGTVPNFSPSPLPVN